MLKSLAPLLIKKSIISVATLAIVLALGCADDSPLTSDADTSTEEAKLRAEVGKALAQGLVRVELVVTGPRVSELRIDLDPDGETAAGSLDVPVGPNRIFTLNGYASDGSLIYTRSQMLMSLKANRSESP